MPVDRRSFRLATLAAGLAGRPLHAEETLAELTWKLALKGEDLSVAVATIRDGQVAEAFSAASEGKAAPVVDVVPMEILR